MVKAVRDALNVYYSVPGHRRKAVVIDAAGRIMRQAEVEEAQQMLVLALLNMGLPDVERYTQKQFEADLKRWRSDLDNAEPVQAQAKRKRKAKR